MSAGAARYERDSELNEGVASYVQERARGFDAPILPAEEFPADGVRDRFYATGPAMGRLLDRLDPSWRERIEAEDTLQLDGILTAASAGASDTCAFASADRERIAARALADAASLRSTLAAQRTAFLARDGWRVEVVAGGEPLWPRGFDPLNVRVVAPGEVLHTRMVRLGNAAGTLEVLGRGVLTVAVGEHPLFNGARQVMMTGLPVEPVVDTANGGVLITAEGLRAEFRGASLEREERRLMVRLH